MNIPDPSGLTEFDIKSVPLQHLRKQIAVVHKILFLFQGSIRTTWNPTGDHDDVTLWSALEEVINDSE